MNIILIDDDAALLRALMRQLSAAGHDVVTFASAEQASYYLDDLRAADAVVSDWHTGPGMSGLKLLGLLDGAPCARVMMTGSYPMPESTTFPVLAKPCGAGEILAAIEDQRMPETERSNGV